MAGQPARGRRAEEAYFTGSRAYATPQLRDDLARFIFLLGGSDGEPLFGPEQQ